MIWIFGDSFSAEYEQHLNRGNVWAIKYCEYLNKIPKVFGEILSNKLGETYKNLAVPGCDNYTIFHSYINVMDEIKKDDILIFGWSNTLRYRLANKENGFCTILAENNIKSINDLFDNLSENTLDELLLIRESTAYYRELEDFIKIINKSSKSKNIYNWSPFPTLRQNVKNINKIAPKGINVETDGLINDTHYGEIGHLSVAMYFYKQIKYNQW